MMKRLSAILALSLPALASAAAPTLKDFAFGLIVVPEAGLPLQELPLPDEVFEGVLRADLADLRVFNAEGSVVPHAFCAPLAPSSGGVREQALPVFVLQRPDAQTSSGGTRVEVQTADGTQVKVEPPGHAATTGEEASVPAAFVIDARALESPLQAIRVQWQSSDGASEVPVRVEVSEDLDRWVTVVESSTLLRTTAEGQTLERARIPLPAASYKYLRLERSDGRAPPRIESVLAELAQPDETVQPVRFPTTVAELNPAAPDQFGFDAGHQAPVETAQVALPMPNMSLRVALESRPSAESAWQQRWSGEVYSLQELSETPVSADIRFAPVRDRYWRVRVLKGFETLGGQQPQLELAYHPPRLRFLAQGSGPYTLAYGSARVEVIVPSACDGLLGALPPDQLNPLIGQARYETTAPGSRMGGEAALQPAPKPTPTRQIVLWAVLIGGAALLVVMALSLLKRMRT
jgi:hypothetical protein